MSLTPILLAINAGSSSLKFRVYTPDGTQFLCGGLIERIGSPTALLSAKKADGGVLLKNQSIGGQLTQAIEAVLALLQTQNYHLQASVHRVVHGGGLYQQAVKITPEVRQNLGGFARLAPLHQPASLAVIDACTLAAPQAPQIACFDTGFHASLPELATRYAIDEKWHKAGLRRYGFHGLSYAYIARQLDSIGLNNKKIIVCHLGSGASLCAMNNGVSVATSMGYSPLSGVSMGTRPGELDADIPLVWQSEYGMSLAEVRDELYKKSGLLGVSGLSNDMRDLEKSTNPKAKMALDLFHYKVIGQIGELTAHLGGLDALIFTAGVGENGDLTRECIIHQFDWLGFELDTAKNALRGISPNQITTPNSLRSAYVIATDEEGEMAMQAAVLLVTQH